MGRKILVVVSGQVVGGHEIQLKTILEDLCAIHDEVEVVCHAAATHVYFSTLSCPVHHVAFGSEGKVWHQWRSAPDIAAALAPEFAQAATVMVSGGTIEACIGAARAAKLSQSSTKVVAYVPMYIDRSLSHGMVGRVYNVIVNRMAGVVDEYLTINRIQAHLLRKHYGRPVRVLENAIQTVHAPVTTKGKRLIFLGRFDDGQKGLVEMIELLDHQDNPYADVVMIGDGPDRAAIVAKAQAAKHIKVAFQPWMSVAGVDTFVGTEDSLIMNSRWEGEPLVVREFTARGLPCVVRDITGMRGVTKKRLRFTDGESLVHALKLVNKGPVRDFVHTQRQPQNNRKAIIALSLNLK
ncbi:glycosyltransferase [Duganella sp. Leaf61]|uniref:glycosyltransferase n=1 Tax=Duganella sp. Leaf61 TaxID=1736227 RepID=UPI0009E96D28|nr:glycosyltransferase [Duganella sp. Leaf61]